MAILQIPDQRAELSSEELRHAVTRFTANPLFLDNEEWLNDDNPYRRQLRPQVIGHLDFNRTLGRTSLYDYANLAAQRLLTTIYETDMMFLPRGGLDGKWEDFQAFYSPDTRHWGELARPALERFSFGFLRDEVDVSGRWTRDSLEAYLRELTERDLAAPGRAEAAIATSADRERAARMWLIQFAPDFLSEASPMIRNAPGSYGRVQSEFFKIIIDEYGYGVHDAKHSTAVRADARDPWGCARTSTTTGSSTSRAAS